jgi:hypothetical protein
MSESESESDYISTLTTPTAHIGPRRDAIVIDPDNTYENIRQWCERGFNIFIPRLNYTKSNIANILNDVMYLQSCQHNKNNILVVVTYDKNLLKFLKGLGCKPSFSFFNWFMRDKPIILYK